MAMDGQFARDLVVLLSLANGRGMCVVLVLISIMNVLVGAQVGTVTGYFYRALLDEDLHQFLVAVGYSLIWYMGGALSHAARDWAAEYLALGWRQKLTSLAHDMYCQGAGAYELQQREPVLDNVDQRIAQEIQSLTAALSPLLSQLVATPLMIVYYSVLVSSYFGILGPIACLLYFALGAVAACYISSPLARRVALQESLEADFRMSHIRVRTRAEAVALYGSAKEEKRQLDANLTLVLRNQRWLVTRHFLLESFTQAHSYLGVVLNCGLLAAEVFMGSYKGSTDKGAVAQLISNSSFATLQLIHSFSLIISASQKIANLAGYTSRVTELFQQLSLLPQDTEPIKATAAQPLLPKQDGQSKIIATHLPIYGACSASTPLDPVSHTKLMMLQKSGLSTTLKASNTTPPTKTHPWLEPSASPPEYEYSPISGIHRPVPHGSNRYLEDDVRGPSGRAEKVLGLLHGPRMAALAGGNWLEYSVHRAPQELYALLVGVFPGVWPGSMLIVPTFQCGAVDLCHGVWSHSEIGGSPEITEWVKGGEHVRERAFEEMDVMLERFLAWEKAICEHLRARGHWADAVDPRTGYALAPQAQGQRAPTREGGVSGGDWERLGTKEEASMEERLASGAGNEGQVARASEMRYSEVYAAEVMLGYEVQEVGACPVVLHPKFGTRAYPASLFTTAPESDLLAALDAVGSFRDRAGEVLAAGVQRSRVVEGRMGKHSEERRYGPAEVELEDLMFALPGVVGGLVVRDLSLRLERGQSLLVMGPSGCGKTTFVRVLGQLVPTLAGCIRMPEKRGGESVLFLPQRPLLAVGGLAAQVMYPQGRPSHDGRPVPFTSHEITRLSSALAAVGLSHLFERLGRSWEREIEWEHVLSGGEQQSLSLARVLYHRPRVAVLDEATSALSEDAEMAVYRKVMDLGITIISISHHKAVAPLHTFVLELSNDGRGHYTLTKVTSS